MCRCLFDMVILVREYEQDKCHRYVAATVKHTARARTEEVTSESTFRIAPRSQLCLRDSSPGRISL